MKPATGKIWGQAGAGDSKKPPAIRANHTVGFGESCMLGRKFYQKQELETFRVCYQRFWEKYSFGSLKTARAQAKVLLRHLRTLFGSVLMTLPSLLYVQCWRETSKVLKSMRTLCVTIAMKCRWNSLENLAERSSGERKSREEEVNVMFRRLWRKKVQQWRQLDCPQSATIIPRKRQISSALTANVVGC